MLLLHPLEIFLPLLDILLDTLDLHLLWLVVQHHQIPVHEVEPIQLVTCLFGVHDVLVDHIGCAFGGVGGSGANLADRTEFAKQVEEGGRVDIVGQILDKEYAIGFWSELVAAGHVDSRSTVVWRYGGGRDPQ